MSFTLSRLWILALLASTSLVAGLSGCANPIAEEEAVVEGEFLIQTLPEDIRFPPAVAENSSITGTTPIAANGIATSTITVLLLDASFAPVPNKIPTFSATNAGNTNVYGVCSSTDKQGLSTCTLKTLRHGSKQLRILTPVEKDGGTVVASDVAPVTTPFTMATMEGASTSIPLPYTDINADLATGCTVTSVTGGTAGFCGCNAAGACAVSFSSAAGYFGPNKGSFSYTVNTGSTSNASAVTLNIVSAGNHAPTLSAIGTLSGAAEDTAFTLSYAALAAAADEADLDGDAVYFRVESVTSGTLKKNGVAVVAGTTYLASGENLAWTPAANANGALEAFKVMAFDGFLTSSTSVAVSVTVMPVNDAPNASGTTQTFAEDTATSIPLPYTDIEGDLATSCSASNPAGGTLGTCACVSGACAVTFTPSMNLSGTNAASFSYTVTANGLTSNLAVANLNITPSDDAPIAIGGTQTIVEDTPTSITLPYTDLEGDLASACAVSAASGGGVAACTCSAGVCTATFTPSLNLNGMSAGAFNYTVTANGDTSAGASMTIHVTPVDDAPAAAGATVAISEDTATPVTLVYSDVEGDQATACAVSNPSGGTLGSCACAGGVCTVTFTPTLNLNGTNAGHFDYTVTANSKVSAAATVHVNLTPVDDAPIGSGATVTLVEDTAGTITLPYTDIESDLAGACAVSAPMGGTLGACACASGTCTVTYTPAANLNGAGAGSFLYTVTANAKTSATATITVNLTPVDDAPIAPGTSRTIAEDTATSITLVYTDVENDQATACAASGEAGGTLGSCACAAGVCTVTFTPTAQLNGAAAGSFVYTVTANGQTSNAGTATINITAVDDAPVASGATVTTNEDTAVVATLPYTDIESDQATACAVSGPTGGTLGVCACVSGACTVTFTPAANLNGVGAGGFSYTVTANTKVSASAAIVVNITPVDDSPVASGTTQTLAEDTAGTINLPYTDIESDAATACTVGTVSGGTLGACACASGVCSVEFTPTANLNGAGAGGFIYSVTANGKTSATAVATVNLTPVDDSPVATGTTVSVVEDTATSIALPYNDTESDLASACSATAVTGGTLGACACVSGSCSVVFTPAANLNGAGAGSFSYTVTANTKTSASAAATINITAVDDTPVASGTAQTFNEDTATTIALPYSDVESDVAQSCAVASPAGGTLGSCACAAGACSVLFTPTANLNGAASFTYTVTANFKTSASATAALTITAVDDMPVASGTSQAIEEDTATAIALPYTDIESDAATACSVSGAAGGTLGACACTAGVCSVVFTPTQDLTGAAAGSFTYAVTAGGQTSGTATATININVDDDAPVASGTTVTFNEDTATTITLPYSDPESDQATTCSATSPTGGTVGSCTCASGACSVLFTPTANLNGAGAGRFSYTVTANSKVSNTATATLNITAVDDAPVASGVTLTINEDTATAITLAYSDVESNPATACAAHTATGGSLGSCACTAGVCTVTFTPSLNLNGAGAGSFSYSVTANTKTSADAVATINITAVDDAPVASGGTQPVLEDTATAITLPYSDVESDQATACAVSGPAGGSLGACACASGVCTATFTPNANLNGAGAGSFSYTVTAVMKTSNSATMTLNVTAVDDTPVASGTTVTTDEDTAVSVALPYTDLESDLASACAATGPAGGTLGSCVCASGACSVTFTPAANLNGAAAGSFAYTVTANSKTSASATATINVTAVDDAPVGSGVTQSIAEDTATAITLAYTDVESDTATACAVSGPAGGTLGSCACTAGACTVTFTPTANLNGAGAGSFAYTVTANGKTSASATATINITADDDAPVASGTTVTFNEDTATSIALPYTDTESDAATACAASGPTGGSLGSCACTGGSCSITFTPTLNLNGSGAGSFSYTVTANGKISAAAMATVNLTPVDDAPTAPGLTQTISEDTATAITLAYADVESDAATACAASSATGGSLGSCACTAGTCTVTFTPTANLNGAGAGSFSYTVTANTKTSASATATINITAVDDSPVASGTTQAFNEDTATSIALPYSDNESDQATACAATSATGGTLGSCACTAGACAVTFTPTLNLNGTGAGTFSYTVTANTKTSNTATATLNITAVDDTPVASGTTQTIAEDTATAITLPYTDIESDQATACAATSATGGSLGSCACTAGACSVTFTPAANLNGAGAGSFAYTVTANSKTSASATATINVTAVDDTPVATNVTATINEDTATAITLAYSDTESDQATACAATSATGGTLGSCACTAGSCSVTFTPAANLNGSAAGSFSFTVTANTKTSAAATATINITAVDDAPVASGTTVSFNEDTATSVTLPYTDVESDAATACTATGATGGSVGSCACASGTCSVTFTPTANLNGAAAGSFSYTVTANGLGSNTGTATINLTAVDDSPVASAVTQTFNEDTATSIALSYSDQEGDQATACAATSATGGSVGSCACTAGACAVTFTPALNLNGAGAGSFSFTVTANSKVSNSATATLNITAVDDAPVASGTSQTIAEDAAAAITLAYTDVESNLATACTATSPTGGTLGSCACASGVCTVTFTPTPDLTGAGAGSFSYTVTANTKQSNTATATINISVDDDAPTATGTTVSFNEDTATSVALPYTDVEGDQASACAATSATGGSLGTCTCTAGSCAVVFTPTLNLNGAGAGSFSYTVTANSKVSNSATATINLTAVDDTPVASGTTQTFNEDTATSISLPYTDVESDQATACAATSATGGTLGSCACTAGACSVTFTPTANLNGAAAGSFSYTVTANSKTSAAATATLNITAVDDAPVASGTTQAFNEDTATSISLPYTDVESHAATACTATTPTGGTLGSCACTAGACSVTFTPTANLNGAGAGSFSYTVTANTKQSNTATATLNITSVDDAPVASGVTQTINEDTPTAITLAYTDIESHQATACTATSPTGGTLGSCACTAGACSVTFTPTANLNGASAGSFSYTVTANTLASNMGAATINITAVDDTPVASGTTVTFNEDTATAVTLPYSDTESDQATACAATSAAGGSVGSCACTAGACSVTFTPTLNLNGSAAASFSYTVTANTKTSNSATATINLTAVDDAPVGESGGTRTVTEDTAASLTLTYTDVESHQATACSISSVTGGGAGACACTSGTCSFTYTPTANLNGTAAGSYAYTVTANGLTSAPVTISVNITAVDDTPVASGTTVTFNEDTATSVTLPYSDTESDQAATCAATSPAGGTLGSCACASGTCSVTFTPTLNLNGAAAGNFSYTVTANTKTSNSATATINLTAVNDAPTLSTITTLTGATEDTALSIPFATLAGAANEADVDGDTLKFRIEAISSGTLTLNGGAVTAGTTLFGAGDTLSWTPAANANGATVAAFTVKAHDGTLASSTSIQVNVNVSTVNDVPTLTTISTLTGATEDTAYSITYAAFAGAANEADNDGDALCFRLEALSSGTLTEGGSGVSVGGTLCTGETWVWTAATNANGSGLNAFTVTASDGTATSGTPVQAKVDVAAVDDVPLASGTTQTINEDTATSIALPYTDVESHTATACAATSATGGSVGACACTAGACSVTFTPAANLNGAAAGSFSYTVTANSLTSASATATINVTAVDDSPVASGLTQTINEDTATAITLAYTDTEADQATACTATAPTGGTLGSCACSSGTCTVTFTPTLNLSGAGAGSFSYTVTANTKTSNTATATINITNANDAPVNTTSTATLTEDTAASITLTYTDADGDLATACATSGASGGSAGSCACTSGTCSITFTPAADLAGTGAASFGYTITANGQTSSSTTVSVNLTAVSDAPTLSAISTLTGATEDTAFSIPFANLAAAGNEADVDGDTLKFRIEAITSGALTINGGAVTAGTTLFGAGDTLSWTPAANANGATVAAFTVKAHDGTLASSTAVQVNVNVSAVNDTPTLTTITTLTGGTEDTALSIPFATLATAGNEADADGDTLKFRIEAITSGTLTINGGAVTAGTTLFGAGDTLSWTPALNVNGATVAAFTVKAHDGALASATAIQVNASVTAVNDAPTLTTMANLSTTEDTALSIPFATLAAAGNEADVDGDTMKFRIEAISAGTLTINGGAVTAGTTLFGTGDTLLWTPPANTDASTTAFTVRAHDGSLASAAAINVVVDFSAVNDGPTLTTISNLTGATEDTAFSITYAMLAAAADEGDVDGTTPMFRIEAVSTGTLTKGGSGVSAGSTTLGTGETIVWTPVLNANGMGLNAFTVKAYDGALASATAIQVKVNVTAVDDTPVASGTTQTINEDSPTSISLPYTDVESNTASACAATSTTGGSVGTCTCTAGACSTTFTPNANLNGAAAGSFTYTVTANGLTSASATATINITAVDDAPVASGLTQTINEDTATAITLAYTDADAHQAATCTATTPTGGTLGSCACASGTCTVTFTPTANLTGNGAGSFSYTVTANTLTSNSATATINITNTNDAPVNTTTTATLTEDTAGAITLAYTDADADQATACAVTSPSGGSAGACACTGGTCSFTFTPNANLNGTAAASFGYTVTANSQTSASTSVSVNITAVNDVPTLGAIIDAYPPLNGGAYMVPLVINEGGGGYEDNQAVTCSVTSSDTTVVPTATCTSNDTAGGDAGALGAYVTLTPSTSVTGTSTITVTVNDGTDTAQRTFTATVMAGPNTLIAPKVWLRADSMAISDGGPIATWTDQSGQSNNATQGTAGNRPTWRANVAGTGATRPVVRFDGTDDYLSLPNFASAYTQGEIFIILKAANDPGTTSSGLWNFGHVSNSPTLYPWTDGIVYDGWGSNVRRTVGNLANALTSWNMYGVQSYPAAWVAYLNGSSVYSTLTNTVAFRTDPELGRGTMASGPTHYYFTGDVAEVLIFSTAVPPIQRASIEDYLGAKYGINVAPHPTLTSTTLAEDTPTSITLTYVDRDGDLATACGVSNVAGGSAGACTCNGSGVCTFTFTPAANLAGAGAGSFAYNVTAGSKLSIGVGTTVNITAVDDAPIASGTTQTFNEDTATAITLAYTDAESNQATACTATSPTGGTLGSCACASGVCTVTFTPTANLNGAGAGSFSYTVTANSLASNTGTATLNITAVDDAPVASGGTQTINEDTATSITLPYTDLESNTATACTATSPTGGTLGSCGCTAGACSVTFTPTLNLNGASAGSFTYTVTANGLTSASATRTITITAVDDAPVASGTTQTINEDIATAITLPYADVESNTATACTATSTLGGSVGTCTCTAGTCSTTFTPTANLNGAAAGSFTYTVTANSLTSANGTATINITAVDDAPVGANFTQTIIEDTATAITLSYTDAESNQATACTATSPTGGTLGSCACASGTCTVTFTPTANLSGAGAGSFSFTVTANSLTSSTSTATINITNGDDLPVGTANSVTITEDTATSVQINYTDADGDLATACAVTAVTGGTPSACSCTSGTCTATFTPTANLAGTGAGSFTFTVTANGVTSAAATKTVNITAANDTPTLAAIPTQYVPRSHAGYLVGLFVDEGGGVDEDAQTVTCSATSSNQSIVANADLGCTSPDNGSSSATSATLTVKPVAGVTGTATITVTVSDGTATAQQTFTADVRNGPGPATVDPRLWLRADSMRPTDGAAVATWTDTTTFGNSGTQATGSSQPTWRMNAAAGGTRPVIRFDGVDDFLALPNFASAFTAGEVYVVLKAASDPMTVNNVRGGLWTFGGGSGGMSHYPWGTDIFDGFGSPTRYALGDPSQPLNQFNVFAVASSSANWNARLNGAYYYTSVTNTVGFPATLFLGRSQYGAQNTYFEGDIAEMVIFNSPLSDGNRATVEDYFGVKYNINVAPHVLLSGATVVEDTPTSIALTYTDKDGDLATACAIDNVTGGTAGACTCNGSGACSFTFTPTANLAGSLAGQFRYAITAAGLTSPGQTVNVNITAANDAPALAAIPTQYLPTSASGFAVALTGDEGGGVDENSQVLTCSATSSNTTLIPNANLACVTNDTSGIDASSVLGNLAITPVAGQTGTSTITVTVNDGTTTSQQTFTADVRTGPSTVTGLSLWLRSDVGVTRDGSNLVSSWADQSGASRHAVQATTAQKPLYVATSSLNSRPSIRFAGTDDTASDTLVPPNFALGSTGASFFIVARTAALQSTPTVLGSGTGVTSNIRWGFSLGAGTAQGAGWAGQTATVNLGNPTVAANTNYLTSYRYDRVNWKASILGTNFSTVADTSWPTSDLGLRIGAETATTHAYPFNGDIAEILVYNREVTLAERWALEDYLASKYALNLVARPTLSTATVVEDTPTAITLTYNDRDGDQATACAVSNLTGGTAGACNCASGVCSFTFTPSTSVAGTGAGGFDYRVTTNGRQSDLGWRTSVNITAVNDVPEMTPFQAQYIPTNTIAVPYAVPFLTNEGGGAEEQSQVTTCSATSSNTAVIANADLVCATNDPGATWTSEGTLTIKTGATAGTSTITVTVSDGIAISQRTFVATVVAGPGSVTAPKLWLRADSMYLSSGTTVASWNDMSGQANHATQSTLANRPIWQNSVVAGRPVIRFDGTDDFVGLPSFSSYTAGEIFVIVKAAADPAPACNGLWNMGGSGLMASCYPWTDGAIYDSFGNSMRKSTENPAANLSTFHVYNVSTSSSRGSANWANRLDGESHFSGTGGTVTFAAAPELGRSNHLAAGPYYFNGDIAEVVFFNAALTAGERANVEDYLGGKYGVNIAPHNTLVSTTVNEDTATTITLTYTDRDGDLATACTAYLAGTGTVGACTCNGAGVCTVPYTPLADSAGSMADTFAYSVTAGGKTSVVSDITINITAVNDAPTLAVIPNQTTVTGTRIRGVPLLVSEGGGIDEVQQTITFSATSSNTTLVPNANVTFAHTETPGMHAVGSSRVDLQACKLEYSIVSPK